MMQNKKRAMSPVPMMWIRLPPVLVWMLMCTFIPFVCKKKVRVSTTLLSPAASIRIYLDTYFRSRDELFLHGERFISHDPGYNRNRGRGGESSIEVTGKENAIHRTAACVRLASEMSTIA